MSFNTRELLEKRRFIGRYKMSLKSGYRSNTILEVKPGTSPKCQYTDLLDLKLELYIVSQNRVINFKSDFQKVF